MWRMRLVGIAILCVGVGCHVAQAEESSKDVAGILFEDGTIDIANHYKTDERGKEYSIEVISKDGDSFKTVEKDFIPLERIRILQLPSAGQPSMNPLADELYSKSYSQHEPYVRKPYRLITRDGKEYETVAGFSLRIYYPPKGSGDRGFISVINDYTYVTTEGQSKTIITYKAKILEIVFGEGSELTALKKKASAMQAQRVKVENERLAKQAAETARHQAELSKTAREKDRMATQWRTTLKEGSETHCGMVVALKPEIIKVQTIVGERWFRRPQLFPSGTHGCRFVNGEYVDN